MRGKCSTLRMVCGCDKIKSNFQISNGSEDGKSFSIFEESAKFSDFEIRIQGVDEISAYVATFAVFIKTNPLPKKEIVEVTFVKANGERIKAKGKEGDSLLDIVVNNSVDLEGYGACEGTLTCSTCHLIFKREDFDRLPDKPTDEELDMLDLAYDLTDTSRLGCQIIMSKDLSGLEVQVPASVNDARS